MQECSRSVFLSITNNIFFYTQYNFSMKVVHLITLGHTYSFALSLVISFFHFAHRSNSGQEDFEMTRNSRIMFAKKLLWIIFSYRRCSWNYQGRQTDNLSSPFGANLCHLRPRNTLVFKHPRAAFYETTCLTWLEKCQRHHYNFQKLCRRKRLTQLNRIMQKTPTPNGWFSFLFAWTNMFLISNSRIARSYTE